jgi:hypothetical protein
VMPPRLCDRGGNGKERRKVLEGREGGFVANGDWCSSLSIEGRAPASTRRDGTRRGERKLFKQKKPNKK